jgi:hypothetical protein
MRKKRRQSDSRAGEATWGVESRGENCRNGCGMRKSLKGIEQEDGRKRGVGGKKVE